MSDELEKIIRKMIRLEVRQALYDVYVRTGYVRASAVGAYQLQETPTPIDEDWINREG